MYKNLIDYTTGSNFLWQCLHHNSECSSDQKQGSNHNEGQLTMVEIMNSVCQTILTIMDECKPDAYQFKIQQTRMWFLYIRRKYMMEKMNIINTIIYTSCFKCLKNTTQPILILNLCCLVNLYTGKSMLHNLFWTKSLNYYT